MTHDDSHPPETTTVSSPSQAVTRRRAMQLLGALGMAATAWIRGREAFGSNDAISVDMIRNAEWLSGMSYDETQRQMMLAGVRDRLAHFEALRAVPLPNHVAPSLTLSLPQLARTYELPATSAWTPPTPSAPFDTAWLTVAELSALVHAGEVSSRDLTNIYLERLRRFDPQLECVITYTEERARAAAARADEELAAGRDRGPLHGIPWGAKDIIAVDGYRTTWGAQPYRTQQLDANATIVDRLDDSGAVLLAKLSVGALAWGDVWFGGTTKNPWKLDQGSSGSSAGSASATAAGLAGFTIGSETWGSIVSPCTRCGTTGLRPTFGRVSRHGVMALAWSMDKLGPIARSVDDCALVFDAIRGADGRDASAVDAPFAWPYPGRIRDLRIGYVPAWFDRDRAAAIEESETVPAEETATMRADATEWAEHDRRTLDVLRELGFELVPVTPLDSLPVDALQIILTAEASAAFDELTRSGRDAELVRQIEFAWPNVFRQGQLIPAVEYLRANRVRALVQAEFEKSLADVDLLVTPSFEGNQLLLTNLTGHPAVVLPNGFRSSDGTPTSITFVGHLFGESPLLAAASSYQRATDHHRRHPARFD